MENNKEILLKILKNNNQLIKALFNFTYQSTCSINPDKAEYEYELLKYEEVVKIINEIDGFIKYMENNNEL